MLESHLKQHLLLNSLRRYCLKMCVLSYGCNFVLIHLSAQALQSKRPIMLVAILGLFKKKKTFLCLTLSSIRAQSRPSETGLTFVFMCQCVRLRESERDGEQVLVCLIALVGVSR